MLLFLARIGTAEIAAVTIQNSARVIVGLPALFIPPGSAAGAELRIGFPNTTTGGGAVIGRHMERGWKLSLEHQGWVKDCDELGGVPARIYHGDDQTKADVGVREVSRFIKENKVQIISGIIWSNVMMAVQRPAFDANAMIVGANAGPTPLAGDQCSPLFVSASFVADSSSDATGDMAVQDGVKTIVGMAPICLVKVELYVGPLPGLTVLDPPQIMSKSQPRI